MGILLQLLAELFVLALFRGPAGIALAFVTPWPGVLVFTSVAIMWLVRDRRLGRYLTARKSTSALTARLGPSLRGGAGLCGKMRGLRGDMTRQRSANGRNRP
jgi:hypothetical protein